MSAPTVAAPHAPRRTPALPLRARGRVLAAGGAALPMGHAPIIRRAVRHVRVPHTPLGGVPLGPLHASLAVRVGADPAGSTWLRGWAAHGNVTALLLFVGLSAAVAVRARSRPTTPSPSVLAPGSPT